MLQLHKAGEATFSTSARYSVRGVFSVTLSSSSFGVCTKLVALNGDEFRREQWIHGMYDGGAPDNHAKSRIIT